MRHTPVASIRITFPKAALTRLSYRPKCGPDRIRTCDIPLHDSVVTTAVFANDSQPDIHSQPPKAGRFASLPLHSGRYWIRTSDPYRVEVVL